MERIYIFTRFERFWHWTQALLVIGMLLTGFEIHGTYHLLGFAKAHQIHGIAAWALIILWVFAIFWHFVTGEWRQYIPTMKNADVVLRHYALGIFRGEPHPFKVTRRQKHNPLQAQAYLMVKVLINPLLWISGLLYLYYNELAALGQHFDLATIALAHTIGAFLMLAFFIAHVYLITTGDTVGAHLKAMLTGWEHGEEKNPR
ncbi:MAG TPA: cytochrome b/b6 domain-containing protein [Accumulibacter sp.]|uniref:cytochrome b/b6 domain-containing protein n=2 Tax=Accumulibacter sp. TaxID=2053492 RepID=UPI0026056DA2|nr:cytochrome b/b6 domain-containing protein [Accumulibacter sp.]MDS4056799.1 cytochrome b/b6 domain-containing protein [Accumulibacter sp.]HMV05023.1 cytochrome b/b6 domain-containing protein [Accumulibacter sp.]HMW62616.1 cytochrome b/b6 domain-containing protein [Accumulibacter sp.]HMW80659.1 cytochrome b/b6 domain-containing protein [Accumulibacter sp.]HMX69834.1 cytochrome b/b6 domain-containing protein [Accumulibacter sp.]